MNFGNGCRENFQLIEPKHTNPKYGMGKNCTHTYSRRTEEKTNEMSPRTDYNTCTNKCKTNVWKNHAWNIWCTHLNKYSTEAFPENGKKRALHFTCPDSA